MIFVCEEIRVVERKLFGLSMLPLNERFPSFSYFLPPPAFGHLLLSEEENSLSVRRGLGRGSFRFS
jgi:hypothetical protein